MWHLHKGLHVCVYKSATDLIETHVNIHTYIYASAHIYTCARTCARYWAAASTAVRQTKNKLSFTFHNFLYDSNEIPALCRFVVAAFVLTAFFSVYISLACIKFLLDVKLFICVY